VCLLFNYKNIIKYSPKLLDVKLNLELLDRAQDVIFAEEKTASVSKVLGTEVINSILNSVDLSDKNLRFKVKILSNVYIEGRKLGYDIRLTQANESKFNKVMEMTEISDESQLLNIICKLFVEERGDIYR